jgi:3',5'-nucleoside bisphosphate phosphatase
MGLIDLHTHSNASDGSLSPRELVGYAREKGAVALALTDHDTIAGLPEALGAGEEWELEVIPGLEISAEYPGGSMHVLGYFIDPYDSNLQHEIATLQQARRERNPKIIEKLRNLGIPIQYEQLQAIAKGQIGRPHIARVLVELKAVSSLDEAFQKYLRKGALAYVEKFRFSPEKAIALIRQAGGLAVLAHPFTLNCASLKELKGTVQDLKALGLEGIEVFYTEHSTAQTRDYLTLALEMDLVATGGTDFHGANKDGVDLLTGLGDLKIPYSILEKLRSRLKKIRSDK